MSFFHAIPSLIKFKISLAVTFTTLTGFIIFHEEFHRNLFLLLAGVFCLASGANALNQIQEEQHDSRMIRTKNRPLPSGSLNKLQAVIFAVLFILAGALLLFYYFPLLTILLGLFNIFWYNVVYTPLKRVTPLAVIPGSLVGALPLLMGWVAAGGSVQDIRIWMLSVFLIIWQIPHFWLILSNHNNDYESAGFPGIERLFSEKNIRYVIFSWMLATVFSSLLLPTFSLIIHPFTLASLISANLLLMIIFIVKLFSKNLHISKYLMISINLYMIIVLLLCIMNVFL
jgi:heme o synthase